MLKSILIISVVLVSVSSCDLSSLEPGGQDFTKDLPNGYIVARTSAHQIQIVPENGSWEDTPIIPTKVIEIAVHNEFIIAYRQGLKPRSPNNPDDSYMLPDPKVFDYWILDTKTPKAYANLDKWKLKKIKDSLKIPNSIHLIDIYDY